MEKINSGVKFPPSVRYDEPMSRHTTFKVGGKADAWVRPGKDIFPVYTARLLKAAREEGVPVFILGAGANIVVSDRGLRGIVLDTGAFRGIGKREDRGSVREAPGAAEGSANRPGANAAAMAPLTAAARNAARASAGNAARAAAGNAAQNALSAKDSAGPDFETLKARRGNSLFSVQALSGTSVDGLASRLAERGLSGLEFLAGMPGSVGGAVWMNARCYEKSVSDALVEIEILDEDFERRLVPFRAEDFSYKKSPFQKRNVLILSARFSVRFRDSRDIRKEIAAYRQDRSDKGHYRFPSAGSAFKNNREFGEPTGKIIDKLGLRGLSIGGAQIAPWHGNIIINTGNALASDIKILMDETALRVKKERGLDLESEILFVGEWD